MAQWLAGANKWQECTVLHCTMEECGWTTCKRRQTQ